MVGEHLRVQWRRTAGDAAVERILDSIGAKPNTGTEWMVNLYRGRSMAEMIEVAMGKWRASFSNSSNIRAWMEGRPTSPSFQEDPDAQIAARVLKEALGRAPALGSVTWRIEAGAPVAGQTLDWSIKAVARERREAEGYRTSLMFNEATMYQVPARAKGVWFPDRREAIISDLFQVESLDAGVAVLR